jgi:aspartyl-tRNA(Asn)/glutamyl-tRNA(Gln) amidotransferase subunit C
MNIGENEVRHVAQLAELAIADADIPLLAMQLGGIVEFVAQLDQVATPEMSASVVVGPGRTPLRQDLVNPIPMTRSPAEMAPAFQQGFYVVPRLDGMSGE